MAAAVEGDGRDWQIVRSVRGAEAARKTVRKGLENEGGTTTASEGSLKPSDSEAASYQSLIGTAIRKDDVPRSESGLNRDSQIRSKIGGLIHIPQTMVGSNAIQQDREKLNLGDTLEWPSMGGEGEKGPHLSSWNTVVKKPPPVSGSKPQQLEVRPREILTLC